MTVIDAAGRAAREDRRERASRLPGTKIQLHVHEGMRLADLHHADPYSYELAAIIMGAASREELRQNFEALWEALGLQFAAKGKARSDTPVGPDPKMPD